MKQCSSRFQFKIVSIFGVKSWFYFSINQLSTYSHIHAERSWVQQGCKNQQEGIFEVSCELKTHFFGFSACQFLTMLCQINRRWIEKIIKGSQDSLACRATSWRYTAQYRSLRSKQVCQQNGRNQNSDNHFFDLSNSRAVLLCLFFDG